MKKYNVELWGGGDWFGEKQAEDVWSAKDDDELFMKMFKLNTANNKNFKRPNSGYGGTWRFPDSDWELQEKYNKWWSNLPEEVKEKVYDEA